MMLGFAPWVQFTRYAKATRHGNVAKVYIQTLLSSTTSPKTEVPKYPLRALRFGCSEARFGGVG